MNLKATGAVTDTLSLITASATTVDVSVSWHDTGSPVPHGQHGGLNTAITTAATTEIMSRPGPYVSRVAKTISIRNKDTASNAVTVVHNGVNAAGTTIAAQIIKVTLDGGDTLMYDEEKGWTTTLTAVSLGVTNTAIAPVDVVNSANNVAADVTGLTWPVLAGKKYRFRAVVPYSSAATTTGSRWMMNGPAITALNGTGSWTIDATTRTTSNFTAYDIPAAANATSLTVGNVAILEGELTPSADGTLAVRFASEVDTSAITALAGSTLTVTRVL